MQAYSLAVGPTQFAARAEISLQKTMSSPNWLKRQMNMEVVWDAKEWKVAPNLITNAGG